MEVITVAVQKGGTGKTTTVAALAQAAVARGIRCLAVDLDPQANVSYALKADVKGRGSEGLLNGEPAEKLIQKSEQGMDVIPASRSLSTITTGRGSARRLRKALEPIRGRYDLILIDTPPTAGELQYNALQAATGLIIPIQADIYDLQSLYQITDTAKQIQKSNPELKILGFVLTRFDQRSKITKKMQEIITGRAMDQGVPYLGSVRVGVSVREAAAFQQSLYEYAPKSNPALDYMDLFDQLRLG